MPLDLESFLADFDTGDEESAGDARSQAILQAMGAVGQAGLRRSASPAGAIAGVLGPILAIPRQAKATEQKQMLQALLLKAQIAKALQGVSPEETALTKAKTEEALATAEEKRAAAKSPFGGKSPTDNQLLLGKLAGDPVASAAYDAKIKQDELERLQQSTLIADRSAASLDARSAEAERKRLAARLPTNQVYVDPSTGERLDFKTVGDLEQSGLSAKAMDTRAAQKIPDIKNAYRELQVLRDVSKRVLYSPEPDEGILGQIMGVKAKRFKTLLESQAGRADIRQFETTKKSAALALGRALTGTGRVPVAEFQAVDALDANRDTVQSADAILGNFERYLGEYLNDLGLAPTVLQSATERAVGLPPPVIPPPSGPAPKSTARPFDFSLAPGPEAEGAKQVLKNLYATNPRASDEDARRAIADWIKGNAVSR